MAAKLSRRTGAHMIGHTHDRRDRRDTTRCETRWMPVARHPDRQRLPTVVRVLLSASFVSDVGSGLTLPFLLIYLHQVRHISLEVTGLLIGLLAVVGLPVGPATGALVGRLGVRAISVLAIGLNALGTASLVLVHSTASAVVPMLLFGL